MRFELLYAKLAPAVKAYALRRADSSTADDVVAEVFVVCWRRFDELPPDPLPWLLGVARKVLSTQRRGERRRGALHDRLVETAGGSSVEAPDGCAGAPPEDSTSATPRLRDGALAGALSLLSEADRELLLLIAWDGLSLVQVAAALDIKPTTARVRLLRARRRLTQALAHERADPTSCPPLSMEPS